MRYIDPHAIRRFDNDLVRCIDFCFASLPQCAYETTVGAKIDRANSIDDDKRRIIFLTGCG